MMIISQCITLGPRLSGGRPKLDWGLSIAYKDCNLGTGEHFGFHCDKFKSVSNRDPKLTISRHQNIIWIIIDTWKIKGIFQFLVHNPFSKEYSLFCYSILFPMSGEYSLQLKYCFEMSKCPIFQTSCLPSAAPRATDWLGLLWQLWLQATRGNYLEIFNRCSQIGDWKCDPS